jgi:hypothetical protein
MMDQRPNAHLSYNDLLRTLADLSDLSPEQQVHFESCHRCRRQAQDIQHRYQKLGQMARSMAPEPSRPFRVPEHHLSKSRWHFKPGVAVGVLGVLIFVFTVWWPNSSEHSDMPVPLAEYSAQEDAQLMAEVDALVHDALPVAYQQVAVVSEPILSKDLIDWIVPSIDEEDDRIEPQA